MWIEEVTLENIKCFEKISIKFNNKKEPCKWVNLLGENGGGKSTVLQAIGLLLSGPEGAIKLQPRPEGWLKDETIAGKISITIHQGKNDSGNFGGKIKERKQFRYTFYITGQKKLTINNKDFFEPFISPDSNSKVISWLRENAFSTEAKGWFAVGFGAFRRLTKSNQIIIPQLQVPARFSNFLTQFNEDEPLAAFERWFTYLDYVSVKEENEIAIKNKGIAVKTINKLLPHGVTFDSVTSQGKILFNINGEKVPTIALSDGYRSILALAGDLLWRLLEAFPDSSDPLKEEGVVLIDELDIHLHPTWQREIAGWLQDQFPNLQFIVATHSPMIAAGAGKNATTFRFFNINNDKVIEKVKDFSLFSVEKILQSPAFGLISPFSPETQDKIDLFISLKSKAKLNEQEKHQLEILFPEVEEALDLQPRNELEREINNYIMLTGNDSN